MTLHITGSYSSPFLLSRPSHISFPLSLFMTFIPLPSLVPPSCFIRSLPPPIIPSTFTSHTHARAHIHMHTHMHMHREGGRDTERYMYNPTDPTYEIFSIVWVLSLAYPTNTMTSSSIRFLGVSLFHSPLEMTELTLCTSPHCFNPSTHLLMKIQHGSILCLLWITWQ